MLIRTIFGAKSEKLDVAQLELLFKDDAPSGKADASTEKVEVAPSAEAFKPAKVATTTSAKNVGRRIF